MLNTPSNDSIFSCTTMIASLRAFRPSDFSGVDVVITVKNIRLCNNLWTAIRCIIIATIIDEKKYHRGNYSTIVPKQVWPLPRTKYHCQYRKFRDFPQLTRVQWKNVNHIAGWVVQIHCTNSYNAKYAQRARSNQFWPLLWQNAATNL